MTFPYMEPLSFFGRLVKRVILSCFSDSFLQKTTQQSDGSCNVTSASQLLYKFKNSLFLSANTYEKKIVSIEHCIARHNDKICSLHYCRYHSNLLGHIKELLQKLNVYCFNYQLVDCLYTLFKYRLSGKIVVKSEQFFDKLQKTFHFNQQTEEWTECAASRTRDS